MKPLDHWSVKLLRLFCPPHLLEEIEGDLMQRYEKDADAVGEKRANQRLVWNTLRYLRPGIVLRRAPLFYRGQLGMINHYAVVGWRHLFRNKFYTAVSVFGLTLGLTAFMLISAYINRELSYENFHENKDSIYRIGLKRYKNGELIETSARTFPGVRFLLKENFPEIKSFTGFFKTPANTGFLFRHNEKIFNEQGGVLNADSAFFSVFPSLLSAGDPLSVLKEPNSLILSETLAKKLFGNKHPIGQVLDRIDDHSAESNFVVRGVLKDIPENSHFHAQVIEQINDQWPESNEDLWGSAAMSTYVALPKSTDFHSVELKLNILLKRIANEHTLVKDAEVFLQSISAIHLSSDLKDELEPNGDRSLLYLIGIVGVIIILIAWINYINLETARFTSRIKEYGIRRINGSRKIDLAIQFFVQFTIVTGLAICFTAIIYSVLVQEVSLFSGVNLKIDPTNLWSDALIIATSFLALGSIAVGISPALLIYRFNPSLAIKGKISNQRSGSSSRLMLTTIQFASSAILIAFVLAIFAQLDFMRSSDKGLEIDHVIAIRNPTAYSGQGFVENFSEFDRLREKLLRYAQFKTIASSSAIPGTPIGFTFVNLIKRNPGDPYDPTIYKTTFVSNDHFPIYGIKFLAGKNFAALPPDFNGTEPWKQKHWYSLILNQRAAKQLGFATPEEAVNQDVYFHLWDGLVPYKIVGIVDDYHHEAVKKEIYPTIFVPNYSSYQQVYYSIRLEAGTQPQTALQNIETVWKEVFPNSPFEYFFLDDYYDQQYKSEVHFGHVFGLFSGVAILIACLGALSMSLFEANSRLKEISIRKVLGATILDVVLMLNKSQVRVVSISALLACPMALFVINMWLSEYPSRIDIELKFLLVPFIAISTLMLAVSSFQSVKASISNPVDHLKNE
ncbi:MAG: ABC transporter permease [Cyclobacteriaceae bacterium]